MQFNFVEKTGKMLAKLFENNCGDINLCYLSFSCGKSTKHSPLGDRRAIGMGKRYQGKIIALQDSDSSHLAWTR